MSEIYRNNVYSLRGVHLSLGIGAPIAQTFNLTFNRRQFKIISISYDVKIALTTGQNVPIDTQTVINYFLQIGSGLPPAISNCFDNFAQLVDIANNGTGFRLFKPCNMKFESFFIDQQLPCIFSIQNVDLLNLYTIEYSIVFEIKLYE